MHLEVEDKRQGKVARHPSQHPTEAELEILEVLWDNGPQTLGDIHREVTKKREVSYSTTRKMTQVMREKKLILVANSSKPHAYRARKTREQTHHGMVGDLLRRAFGGNANSLMMSLVRSKSLSDEDLDDLQKMIEEARGANR